MLGFFVSRLEVIRKNPDFHTIFVLGFRPLNTVVPGVVHYLAAFAFVY